VLTSATRTALLLLAFVASAATIAACGASAGGPADGADPDVGRGEELFAANCASCHAEEVYMPGLAAAPGGVMLDSDARIAAQAEAIYLQAGVTHAMPPGNFAFLTDADRALIRRWYREATRGAR